MKHRLDMDKVAAKLGAERRGKVKPSAGHFGAWQLVHEVAHRRRAAPDREDPARQDGADERGSEDQRDS